MPAMLLTLWLLWASISPVKADPDDIPDFFPRQPYATFPESNSAFITFEGDISAQVWYPPDCCRSFMAEEAGCNGTSDPYGPFGKTSLLVGVNPHWDTNDWFFELYHSASEIHGIFTNDTIRELDFASAVDSCWQDDRPCGPYNFNPTFIGEPVLDLSKADVKKTTYNGSPGYAVTGDSGAFLVTKNVSYMPSVEVAASCAWLDSDDNYLGSLDWGLFVWSPGVKFEYSLSFSNSSAEMTIETHFNGSTMQLDFSGSRSDNKRSQIELLTSDSKQPKFERVDGQAITFSNSAAPTPTTSMTSTQSQEPAPTFTTSSSTDAAAHGSWPGNSFPGSVSGSSLVGLLLALFI